MDTEKDVEAIEAEETVSGEAPEPISETETEEPKKAGPAVKAGRYRIFSVILFVLTAGGLFLGLIGNKVAWLRPSYYKGSSGLNNSLLGFFFTRMKELFSNIKGIFTGSAGTIFQNVFAVLAALLLLITLVISIASLVSSFVSAKSAKRAAALSGTMSVLSYTLLFLWAFCVNSLTLTEFRAQAIDVPVAIITLLLFVVMAAFTVMENGKKGICNVGVYLFAVAACLALFFPGSFTESHFRLLETYSKNPTYNFLVVSTSIIILLNLIVSALSFSGLGRGIVRTILFMLQLIATFFLALAGCGLDGTWGLKFFQNGSLLPSLTLLIATLGGVVLSILVIVTDQMAKMPKTVAEEAGSEGESVLSEGAAAETPAGVYAEGAYWEAPKTAGAAYETAPALSAFEREMLTYAEKGDAATETEEQAVPPAPAYAPAPAPTFRPVNVYTDPSMQYVYDPFINELTHEEKDEFGDLFIACKSGKFGDLPVYKIGGDNAEFFDKVWIRYGLYDMSQNLRDKLFSYLRRYRSKQ